MSASSNRLRRTIKKAAGSAPSFNAACQARSKGPSQSPGLNELISGGLDPVHAAYTLIHNAASFFLERTSGFPEMRNFGKIVAAAEDEYLPSGPPMSPLTRSYFNTWALFDLRFSGDHTVASYMIESNDARGMTPDQLDALKMFADSRMGLYEQVGMVGPRVVLRELITGREFICHNTSGYEGRTGQLWYARILPPLVPETANYHIVFTTPYILMASKGDWLQFLKRTMSTPDHKGLHQLLKFGPEINYWNEYVFAAYHQHQADAIFLAGIPDRKETLPHG